MKVVKTNEKKIKNKEVKDFQSKWKEHKQKYIKDHSVAEMVYENGSAIALLYKELQTLNTNLKTIINGKEDQNTASKK